MPTASSSLKNFSPKSRDAVALQQIKERGALPVIDRGDIRQAIDRYRNIWASLPGAVMVSSGIRLTAWLQKFKKPRRASQKIDVWAESPRLSPLWLSASSSLSWAVNHYRGPRHYLQSPATKMPENWSWRTRQLLTCRCVSVMFAALDAKYEGVSWC